MKGKRFSKSLRLKITMSVVISVLLIAGLFSLLQFLNHRQAMIHDLEGSAIQVGEVIESSLRRAMLRRDLESMQETVDEIAATQEDIGELLLIDKRGEIKVSPQGRRVGEVLVLSDPTCQICHRVEPENRSQSAVFVAETGEQFLRNVNPIANEEQCHGCHDPQASINGVLITDLSMTSLNAQLAADLRENLLLSLGMIVAVAATVNFMMSSTVVNRIEAMADTVRRLSSGDLEQRAPVGDEDELGELALAFNEMADGLKEKARLERKVYRRTEELRKQTQRLLALNSIAATVNRSLDLGEMLDAGLSKVLELLKLDAGLIWLIDDGQKRLVLQTHLGLTEEFVEGEERGLEQDECLCGLAARSGETIVVPDLRSDQRLTGTACEQGGYLSLVLVPLTSRERVLGVMTLQSKECDHFGSEDIELLEAIGKQLGIAIENAQLYKGMEEEVRERTRHLQLLYEITRAMSAELEIEPLLRRMVSETARAVEARAGIAVIAEGTAEGLREQALHGSPSTQLIRKVQSFLDGGEEREEQADLIIAPISSRGRIIGALGLESKAHDRPFTTQDHNLLRGVAAQAAIAIENARLYQEVQEVAILEERERLAREMHDGLAQTLGYLRLRLQIAGQQISSGQVEEGRLALAEIERTAEEAYADAREAIADLKMVISKGADFVSALEEYVEEFGLQNRMEARFVSGLGEEIRPTTPQAVQLIRIVQEALSNVRKHAQATTVWVKLAKEGNSILLAIEDNGQGFDTHQVKRHKDRHYGLDIMRERAESLKGRIEIYSAPGEGTNLVVKIPLEERRR
ncbi:MAG: GAF domain-containing protein [Anaerolineae bacterium]